MSVLRKATTSALWLIADDWFSSAISLISLLVLAVILGPEVYGIVGIAGTVLAIGGIFWGGTLTDSLEQRDTIEPGHIDAIYWINFTLGALYAILMALAAPFFAALFDVEALGYVMPVMAFGGFVTMQSEIPCALIARSLDHKKVVLVEAAFDIPLLLISVGLAIGGYGVWSLIVPSLIYAPLAIFIYARLADWRPGFAARPQHFRDLWAFNRDTVATNCLGYLDGSLPKLMLGYFFGEREVGLFGLAMSLSGQLSGTVMGAFGSLAMTVTARLQNEIGQVRQLMDDVFELTAFIMYPATIGAILVIPLAAPLFLGQRWDGVVLPLQLALLLGLRDATGAFNIAILRGLGKTHVPLYILSVGVVILCMLAPVFLPYASTGIVALVTLRLFMTWPLSAWLVQRHTDYPAIQQLLVGWRSFLAALVMGLVVYGVQTALPASLSAYVEIACAVIAGIAVYTLIYLIIWPNRISTGVARAQALWRGDGELGSDTMRFGAEAGRS